VDYLIEYGAEEAEEEAYDSRVTLVVVEQHRTI
jgi:hypothetical protein